MGKCVGYMVTWTTYGTWLQGDKRGYVDDGQICQPDDHILRSNLKRLKNPPTFLNTAHCNIVGQAIMKKAQNINQKIYAIAACSNHVHIVAERTEHPIGKIVGHYKNAARLALRANGFNGRIWTRGFDKRFCFDQQQLDNKIRYVKNHNKNP